MLAIIADVHGNFPALRAVLEEIDAEGIDTVVSLGDIAGYYCMINECIRPLRERAVINIMGNHDHYLVSGTPCPRSTSANACLEYQRARVEPANLEWLSQSPPLFEGGAVSMRHGGWNDLRDEYLYAISADMFSNLPWRFFFSAHTHVHALAQLANGKTYANPGSVGQPRDADPRAAWATFDGENVVLRRTAYDITAIATAMREAGFAASYYTNLSAGVGIGRQADTFTVHPAGGFA